MMRKYLYSALLLLTILGAVGVMACSSEVDPYPSDMEISQDLAWKIVKEKVLHNELDNIEVYVSINPKPPKYIFTCPYHQEQSPDFSSWVFFIDDAPSANFSHALRYAYVNILGGRLEVHSVDGAWPHEMNCLYFKPIIGKKGLNWETTLPPEL